MEVAFKYQEHGSGLQISRGEDLNHKYTTQAYIHEEH